WQPRKDNKRIHIRYMIRYDHISLPGWFGPKHFLRHTYKRQPYFGPVAHYVVDDLTPLHSMPNACQHKKGEGKKKAYEEGDYHISRIKWLQYFPYHTMAF